MLVGFYAAENIYFVDCALLEFLVLSKTGDGYYLHCILFLVCIVYSPVDFTVYARPDDFVKRVVFNVLDHALFNSK